MREAERAIIIRALQTAGCKTDTARARGISYKTLFNKINDLDIHIRSEIE
jgi:DNA-binding NtrC family response regulator